MRPTVAGLLRRRRDDLAAWPEDLLLRDRAVLGRPEVLLAALAFRDRKPVR
jgi:hypothetical protein